LTGEGWPWPPRGRRQGCCRPPPRPPPLRPAPPRARWWRARRGTAVAMARRRGGRPGFLGPSQGGGQPEAAAASTTVPRCRCPPGAVPSTPPCRLDGLMVMTVMTAPALQPAATLAMATPLRTTTPPPLPSLAKQMTRDRRTRSMAATTGTMTRMMTSGGGARSSTCPPLCHHCSSATLSAMPLPRPACCCWALRCLGSMSNTATP
jgi:hypothetical protein